MTSSDVDITDYCVVSHDNSGSDASPPKTPPPSPTSGVGDFVLTSESNIALTRGLFPVPLVASGFKLGRSTSEPNSLKTPQVPINSTKNDTPPVEYRDRVVYKYLPGTMASEQRGRFANLGFYDVGLLLLSLLASFGIGRVTAAHPRAP